MIKYMKFSLAKYIFCSLCRLGLSELVSFENRYNRIVISYFSFNDIVSKIMFNKGGPEVIN